MLIKLKGQLDPELTAIGLQPGDEITAQPDPMSKVGGMHFTAYYRMQQYNCSVWPENYEIIHKN